MRKNMEMYAVMKKSRNSAIFMRYYTRNTKKYIVLLIMYAILYVRWKTWQLKEKH